ncbi:MAG: hypothetical protein RR578_04100, partial [Bacilli bacterium]
FFKMSDGALAAFAWDSKTSDPTHVDIVSDQDFYLTAKELNKVFEQKKYDKAIKAYKILILKYPEKNSLFANRIKGIENLKNSK